MWQSTIGNSAIRSLHLFLYKTKYFSVVDPTNRSVSVDLSPFYGVVIRLSYAIHV